MKIIMKIIFYTIIIVTKIEKNLIYSDCLYSNIDNGRQNLTL